MSVLCFNSPVSQRNVQNRPRPHVGESTAEVQILEAAERLLETNALQELSVADILTASGISRTTFYFYFSSKFAVISRLLELRANEFLTGALSWLGAGEDAPPDAFDRAMRMNLEVWQQHGPLMRAVSESIGSDPDLRAQWMAFADRIVEAGASYIDAERKAGNYPPGLSSRVLASAMFWSLERIQYVSATGIDARLSSTEDVLAFTEVLWRGTVTAGHPPAPKKGPSKAPKKAPATRRRS